MTKQELNKPVASSMYKMSLLEELELSQDRRYLVRVHKGWVFTTYFNDQLSSVFIPASEDEKDIDHPIQAVKESAKTLFITSLFFFVASVLILLISHDICSAGDQQSASTQQSQSASIAPDPDPIVCKNVPNKQQSGVYTIENQYVVRVCKKKSEWVK